MALKDFVRSKHCAFLGVLSLAFAWVFASGAYASGPVLLAGAAGSSSSSASPSYSSLDVTSGYANGSYSFTSSLDCDFFVSRDDIAHAGSVGVTNGVWYCYGFNLSAVNPPHWLYYGSSSATYYDPSSVFVGSYKFVFCSFGGGTGFWPVVYFSNINCPGGSGFIQLDYKLSFYTTALDTPTVIEYTAGSYVNGYSVGYSSPLPAGVTTCHVQLVSGCYVDLLSHNSSVASSAGAAAYDSGYSVGYSNGVSDGYGSGYSAGSGADKGTVISLSDTFNNIVTLPWTFLSAAFGNKVFFAGTAYEFNFGNLLQGILTVALGIAVISAVFKIVRVIL